MMTPTKILGVLLVIVYIVALKALAVLDIRSVFEHRLLLPVLNTIFAGIVPIVVAYVAHKAYVKGGFGATLFMGCGMLSFGLCAIAAGWLIRASNGANLNVTIYNTGALLGSGFHIIGVIFGLFGADRLNEEERNWWRATVAYICVTVFVLCFSLAALEGLTPPFFIQGVGPTDLRQGILGSAVLLYCVSSLVLMAYYFKVKSDFLYWYSLCLAMLAIGLFAFFVQKSVGCPIGWLGRSANYVGGAFAVVAILRALRDAKTSGVSLEESIAGFFGDSASTYKGRILAVLPIPIVLILLVILASLDLKVVFEPPGLFAALNTLFLTVLPVSVVYFATRSYLHSGVFTMLMLGSGALTMGLGSLLSGWIMALQNGGPNAGATVINSSFLLSAIFHLVGGASAFLGARLDKEGQHKGLIVALTYISIAALMALLTLVTLKGLVPVFFVQGVGPTPLRQVIVGSAVVLFSVSAVLLMGVYVFSRTNMLYWYSLALFLLTTGLICYMCAKLIGGPIAWLGRSAQYLAGIYLFVAVISASRELHTRGESLQTGIANLFRHHLDLLVEERTLQLSRAKEALQAAHNELKRSNTDLQQFAYVASHDLQEPLRMISSYMRLLERKYKGQLDQDADEFIGYAVDGAQRMQSLINDLLEYSRVGTHAKPFEPVDCGELLEHTLANLRMSIEDCRAEVTCDFLPVVPADRTQMIQLFQNLIGNALKFRKDERPSIHISAKQADDSWLFQVRDNGIGMDCLHADRIFVMFQRLHGRDEYSGTGIGLAICKKIVERHGGSIWVESEPGKGAAFYFTIPSNGTGSINVET
jgi:signal transduction histidine kinase